MSKAKKILKEKFFSVKLNEVVNAELGEENLILFNENLREEILLADLIGSFVEESIDVNERGARFILNAYPRNSPNELKRRKISIELIFNSNTRENNLNVVRKWQSQLDHLTNTYKAINNSLSIADSRPKTKPFLLFVNPSSGAGKAKSLFLKQIVHVFTQANCETHVIVTVSGDGLIFEIINGLMSRADWQRAIKTPVGQLPAGSANGLACSVAYLTNEEYKNVSVEEFASSMTFCMSRAQSAPLDLINIQLSNGKLYHGFLNVEWAIVSDVDLESENYRFLGSLRFLVGGLKRIINLRKYRGRLSFLPANDLSEYKPKDASIKIKKNTSNYSSSKFELAKSGKEGLDFKYLPPMEKPVPNDWLTIEETFVLFLVANLPLIGGDLFVAPGLQFNDGKVYLSFIREGAATKLDLLNILINAGDGQYLNNASVEHVAVKAFRLEPLPSHQNSREELKGNLMIDGESVEYCSMQAEVAPGMARVLLKK